MRRKLHGTGKECLWLQSQLNLGLRGWDFFAPTSTWPMGYVWRTSSAAPADLQADHFPGTGKMVRTELFNRSVRELGGLLTGVGKKDRLQGRELLRGLRKKSGTGVIHRSVDKGVTRRSAENCRRTYSHCE